MIRQQQRAAARAQGYGRAQEINIPLPTKGMFVEAKSAEVLNFYAGELKNWRSTGASLRLRSQHSLASYGNSALQRIAFEFGSNQRYIEVMTDRLEATVDFWLRDYTQKWDAAFISSHAVMVDGNGKPVLFNGTTFSKGAFTTETDITQEDFTGVLAHQDRLYFWKAGDDLDFYYGDVGAIMGELTRYPLGRLGNITGTILCLKSLTVDAGHGMNDVLAVFTSTGDIVAYEGLDPGNYEDWRLLTRIKAAPPLSKHSFIQVGADVWMITAAGVVSVTQTLSNSSLALVNTVSRPVQEKLLAQIKEGGEWSMHLTADATSVIINRVFEGEASQFIYRTDTKSWMEADYPARDWHNLCGKTQFTTLDGQLATLDEAGETTISARWESSWFRLPSSGAIAYLKPTIIANGPLEVKVALLSDHDATGVDVYESEQTVTIEPDDPADPGGRVALNEIIAVDAVGEVFQLIVEVSAQWAEIVNMKAGVQ